MNATANDDLPPDHTRRALLAGVAVCAGAGVWMAISPRVEAADAGASSLPMLQEKDPAAQATQYVTDVHRAKGALTGASCSNCSLYGSLTPKAGTCSIFPKNQVTAGGWCTAWASL